MIMKYTLFLAKLMTSGNHWFSRGGKKFIPGISAHLAVPSGSLIKSLFSTSVSAIITSTITGGTRWIWGEIEFLSRIFRFVAIGSMWKTSLFKITKTDEKYLRGVQIFAGCWPSSSNINRVTIQHVKNFF